MPRTQKLTICVEIWRKYKRKLWEQLKLKQYVYTAEPMMAEDDMQGPRSEFLHSGPRNSWRHFREVPELRSCALQPTLITDPDLDLWTEYWHSGYSCPMEHLH